MLYKLQRSIGQGRLFLLLLTFTFSACGTDHADEIITVTGPIASKEAGISLIHEHVLVDFIGADSTGYHRWNREVAFQRILPFIEEVRSQGVKTFYECTPAYLGRDPMLLQQLSVATGVHFVTNTGLYGAVDNKYLPQYAYDESADELATRWIKEFEDGIEETGIRPGFIKTSVNPGPLSALHRKLITAAARTHAKTGLTIYSHTGPAVPALEQLKILDVEGVLAEAFVWVHAQNEGDLSNHIKVAKMGAWVSLDGLNEENQNEYLRMIKNLKEASLLNKVLISHDAGWYTPGDENGGNYRAHNVLLDQFIPLLRENRYTKSEIEMLLVTNPQNALAVRKRLKGEM